MRSVRKVTTNIGQTPSPHRGLAIDLRAQILDRMNSTGVWTPNDFLDMGSRAAVDKVLQRLATSNTIRRIDRGLYDVPRVNRLTGKPTNPDYRAVIDAVARRDKARLLVDGITAANQLGLTNAELIGRRNAIDQKSRLVAASHRVDDCSVIRIGRLPCEPVNAWNIVESAVNAPDGVRGGQALQDFVDGCS